MTYRQGLFRKLSSKIITTICWIPDNLAKKGSWYELKGLPDYWKLIELYDIKVDEKTLESMKNAHRTQRKVSDY